PISCSNTCILAPGGSEKPEKTVSIEAWGKKSALGNNRVIKKIDPGTNKAVQPHARLRFLVKRLRLPASFCQNNTADSCPDWGFNQYKDATGKAVKATNKDAVTATAKVSAKS